MSKCKKCNVDLVPDSCTKEVCIERCPKCGKAKAKFSTSINSDDEWKGDFD